MMKLGTVTLQRWKVHRGHKQYGGQIVHCMGDQAVCTLYAVATANVVVVVIVVVIVIVVFASVANVVAVAVVVLIAGTIAGFLFPVRATGIYEIGMGTNGHWSPVLLCIGQANFQLQFGVDKVFLARCHQNLNAHNPV